MKLPWDKNYLKIAFHVVITASILGAVFIILARLPEIAYFLSWFLGTFVNLMAPLIIGIVLAFLLDPLVQFFNRPFERKKNDQFTNRKIGATICYILIFILVGLGILRAVKNLGATDMTQWSEAITAYINEFSEMLLAVQVKISYMGIFSTLNTVINNLIRSVTMMLTNLVAQTTGKVTSIGTIFINIFVGFVVAFYFLLEKERILFRLKEITEAVFPKRISEGICNFFYDVTEVFNGYVTGQMIDAFIMGSMIIVSFWIAGLSHPVLIGVISGVCNLIPYVGAVVGFTLAITIGLITGTPAKALLAAIIILIVQQVDSMIIIPNVVGKRVRLHPVLVILSLAIFGKMFGFFGMLLAVPVTALLKKFFDRYVNKRLSKP